MSASDELKGIDNGNDDMLNRIIWFSCRGDEPYPEKMTIPLSEREDEDDD